MAQPVSEKSTSTEDFGSALWHLFGPQHVRGAVALTVGVVVVLLVTAVLSWV